MFKLELLSPITLTPPPYHHHHFPLPNPPNAAQQIQTRLDVFFFRNIEITKTREKKGPRGAFRGPNGLRSEPGP